MLNFTYNLGSVTKTIKLILGTGMDTTLVGPEVCAIWGESFWTWRVKRWESYVIMVKYLPSAKFSEPKCICLNKLWEMVKDRESQVCSSPWGRRVSHDLATEQQQRESISRPFPGPCKDPERSQASGDAEG